jgi:hypothetical protein
MYVSPIPKRISKAAPLQTCFTCFALLFVLAYDEQEKYQETFPGVKAMAKLNSKGYGKTQPNSTQKATAKLNPTQLKKLRQNSTQLNSKSYGKTRPNSTHAFMNYFWGCSIVS